jgi:hypothetical protein
MWAYLRGTIVHRSAIKTLIAGLFVFLGGLSSAWGLVLQNEDQPTDRPDDLIVGAWNNTSSFYSNGASCVVIAPDYILTTRHQGNGTGTIITIDGVNYTVNATAYDTTINADIRVAHLIDSNGRPANLKFVGVYTGTDEVGKSIVIGGCGLGGTAVYDELGITLLYYSWDANNSTASPYLRWGTNKVSKGQYTSITCNSMTSDVIFADFSRPYKNGTITYYDAAIANHDSGGGWFIKDTDGQWKVAGLSAYLGTQQHTNAATYGDSFYAVRVSSYANWIANYTVNYGDADRDGVVDVADLGILAANYGQSDMLWDDGDFNADGCVDVGDLGILAANYGTGTSGADFEEDFSTVTNTAGKSSEIDDNPLCSSLGLVFITSIMLFMFLMNVDDDNLHVL